VHLVVSYTCLIISQTGPLGSQPRWIYPGLTIFHYTPGGIITLQSSFCPIHLLLPPYCVHCFPIMLQIPCLPSVKLRSVYVTFISQYTMIHIFLLLAPQNGFCIYKALCNVVLHLGIKSVWRNMWVRRVARNHMHNKGLTKNNFMKHSHTISVESAKSHSNSCILITISYNHSYCWLENHD